mmetsp:Transcript_4813/g.7707  ORF Transcript_4813/g.7707 Transcript_4813/m.7707 type:complete len:162 (+) Transcript_4813:47-532(+)
MDLSLGAEENEGSLGELAFEMEIDTAHGRVGICAIHMEAGDPLPAGLRKCPECQRFRGQAEGPGLEASGMTQHALAPRGVHGAERAEAAEAAGSGSCSPNSVVDTVVAAKAWRTAGSIETETKSNSFDYCKDSLKLFTHHHSKASNAGRTPFDLCFCSFSQ